MRWTAGVIAETKSSLFGAFKFLAALPPEIRSQLQQLGEGEIANPTPSGQPDIFKSEGRDAVDPGRVRVGANQATEDELKKGLGKPNASTGLNTQMSHEWIRKAIAGERLTAAGGVLAKLIRNYHRDISDDKAPPYGRWIVMVTGRQKHLHEERQGHLHQTQQPLVVLPDNILEE